MLADALAPAGRPGPNTNARDWMTDLHRIEHVLHVGQPVVLRSQAPTGRFGVVFEDDGETGYFYATQLSRWLRRTTVLDALALYNVDAVKDRALPHQLTICWSPDGLHAALLINGFPHAAFDFQSRRAGCMTAFPPPFEWCQGTHEWRPALVDFLASQAAD
jgi:hypothetical protein